MTTAIQGTSTNQAAAAAAATSAAASTTDTASDIQDRFLKLLITQIQNQDPLNPMDNAQITNQLAQINTVNGISQLNTTMQSLANTVTSSQTLQSASLIGRSVISEGNTFTLTAGKSALGGVDLPQAVDSVKVSIMDAAGKVVRTLDLGAHDAGMAAFQWDGKTDAGASAAAGAYTFLVKAASGLRQVTGTPIVAGTVTSITLGTDGLRLSVDGIGDVQMQKIKSIM